MTTDFRHTQDRSATSGWIDGELEVQESLPSVLNDEIMVNWDPSTAFPRKSRFLSCLALLFIGTASYLYKNTVLVRSNEIKMLDQIQKSIEEMDKIAANAIAMEAHADRLFELTKPQVDMMESTKSNSISQEDIRAQVESIHSETVNHMQNMMEAMVESTQMELHELAAQIRAKKSVNASSSNFTSTPSSSVDQDEQDNALNQNYSEVNEDASTAPQEDQVKQEIHPNASDSSKSSHSIASRAKEAGTRFWIFTIAGTTIITACIAYYMQQRDSFRQDRLAFQRGFGRFQSLVYGFQAQCSVVFARLHVYLQSIFDSLRQLWSKDAMHLDEISEEEVSFYPQTPLSERRARKEREEIDESTLPRKHITFADIEMDDQSDDFGDFDSTAPRGSAPNMVRANEYGSILTPDGLFPVKQRLIDEETRRRSPRLNRYD